MTLATSLKLVKFSVSEVVTNKHSNYSQTKSWCSHNSHRQKCLLSLPWLQVIFLFIAVVLYMKIPETDSHHHHHWKQNTGLETEVSFPSSRDNWRLAASTFCSSLAQQTAQNHWSLQQTDYIHFCLPSMPSSTPSLNLSTDPILKPPVSNPNPNSNQQEAQLSHKDRAMCYVRWHLVNCCTTVSKLAFSKACSRCMTFEGHWNCYYSRGHISSSFFMPTSPLPAATWRCCYF